MWETDASFMVGAPRVTERRLPVRNRRDLRAATVKCVVADLPDGVINGLASLRDVLPVRLTGRVQSGLNPGQPTPSQPNARRKPSSSVKGPPARPGLTASP